MAETTVSKHQDKHPETGGGVDLEVGVCRQRVGDSLVSTSAGRFTSERLTAAGVKSMTARRLSFDYP